MFLAGPYHPEQVVGASEALEIPEPVSLKRLFDDLTSLRAELDEAKDILRQILSIKGWAVVSQIETFLSRTKPGSGSRETHCPGCHLRDCRGACMQNALAREKAQDRAAGDNPDMRIVYIPKRGRNAGLRCTAWLKWWTAGECPEDFGDILSVKSLLPPAAQPSDKNEKEERA